MEESCSVEAAVRCLGASAGLAVASYATYVGVTWLRYGRVAPSSGDDIDRALDRFMPTFEVVERHEKLVGAPADVTVMTASQLDIKQSAIVRALFAGRAVILGGKPDRSEGPQTLLAWMQSFGWSLLSETEGRQVVVGSVIRPWEAESEPRLVTAAEFASFAEPGYVKVVSTWAATPVGLSGSRLTIATRVATTDATARSLFRIYWALFSPGSLVIRALGLGLVKREAERMIEPKPLAGI